MKNKKQSLVEFRFYDLPKNNPYIIFSGNAWRRVYGDGAPNLHFHNVLEVGICHEGHGKMVYEDGEKDYHEGMISVIPRNTPHNTMNTPGEYSLWSYIFFDVHAYLMQYFSDDPNFLEKTERRINLQPLLGDEKDFPVIASAATMMLGEKDKKQPYAKEITGAAILQIMMAAARANRAYDDGATGTEHRHRDVEILSTLTYIENHYAEPLSVGDLAAKANISETHYRRMFKENMNMTPADYLNMVRIQKACTLLIRTDYPVDIIAEKSGFTTLSTFNRNFRHFMNETPLKWRKAHLTHDATGEIRVKALNGWTDTIL